jgi:xylulokinase
MVDTSGTANHLCFCVPEFKADLDAHVLSYYPSISEELGYQIGFTAGTGKSHRWAADILLGKPPYYEINQAVDNGFEELEEEASKIPPGSEGVTFVPHFGGRACPPMPDIKGAWVGLEWHHSRAHLYRAVLESIAYEYSRYLDQAKELYPEESFSEFYSVGGGSKSPLWTQIKSDVLGVPGKIITGGDNLAARGSALIAAQAVGEGANFLASRYRQATLDIQPNTENTAHYDQYKSAYLELTDHLVEAMLENTDETK